MKIEHIIINKNVLKERLSNFDLNKIPDLEEKRKIVDSWITEIEDKGIEKIKEESLKGKFLEDIFSKVLGYKSVIGNKEWNLEVEQKTRVDSKKADGALGFFSNDKKDIHAVIELKDGKTNLDLKQSSRKDNRTPVEQAFDYATKSGKNCKWVIVSNFKEIRLYNYTNTRMEEYHLFDISKYRDEEKFKEFYYMLNFNNLINKNGESETEKLCYETVIREKEITKKFYNEIKNIRRNLFDTLKKENPTIEELPLFEKTQKLIDRFLFVYFAEDKGILPPNTVYRVSKEAKSSGFIKITQWDVFKQLFECINTGCPDFGIYAYNGGLFKKDEVLDSLNISDEIIMGLVRLSEYDFDGDLNVNILGHIFEQSLSDIEEIKASINGESYDEKQGKRKKDGIFYTPEFITKYIVEKSIGGWFEDRKREIGIELFESISPEQMEKDKIKKGKKFEYKKNSKSYKSLMAWKKYREILKNIKVIDPACGSGAFLIQALNYLVEEGNKVNKVIMEFQGGTGELFTLKADILKNNLYGVDINRESVEITKLSLWLNSVRKEEKLTSLDDHIKCGNSLFFDWHDEFKEIFENGGFDVVIGNPPYVRQERITEIKSELEGNYKTYSGTCDLFVYFYELGYNILKDGGYLGYITSNKWMRTRYGGNLREFLKENVLIKEIVDLGGAKIFEDASVDTNILIFKKEDDKGIIRNNKFKAVLFNDFKNNEEFEEHIKNKGFTMCQSSLSKDGFILIDKNILNLKKKIEKIGIPLKDWDIKIYRGVLTGFNDAFIIDGKTKDELIKKDHKNKEIIKPILRGRDIKRYGYEFADLWLINTHNGLKNKNIPPVNVPKDYPVIYEWLKQFEEKLKKRCDKGDNWWNLRNCAYLEEFEKEKIVWNPVSGEYVFAYIESEMYFNNSLFMITGDNLKYLLTLLNSKAYKWIMTIFTNLSKIGNYAYGSKEKIEKLPIPKIPENEQIPFIEKADKMIELNKKFINKKNKFLNRLKGIGVNKISKKLENFYTLDFNELIKELKKQKIKLPLKEQDEWEDYFNDYKNELNEILSEIEKTDKEIDKMVYKLYNLTDEEINIIENIN